MSINITSKHMVITPAIREHIELAVTRLKKWQTDLINPHITLSKESQCFVAGASIGTPGNTLIAKAKHGDMYTAINELIDKLERQLNKAQHKGEARRTTSLKEPPYQIE